MMSSSTGPQAPFPPSCAPNWDRLDPHPDMNFPHSEDKAGYITYIPGDPAVNLVLDEVHAHLSDQLNTPLLDELHDQLWLVGRKSGLNIDALHMQRAKGRNIIATEDPRLHLVWDRGKIYIKPVPVFLLNHDFWTIYLPPPEREPCSKNSPVPSESATVAFDRSVAVGFLRSYSLLVSHRLDFVIAKESHLIPDDIDWPQWSRFICHLRRVEDEAVAKRFHYGQLRLSRLNWAVRIFRPRHAGTMWFYEIPHWSTTEFVAKATLPLVFVFASVSLLLSSMQVALAVPSEALRSPGISEDGLQNLSRAFWMFSIVAVLLWVVVLWGYRNRGKKSVTGIAIV
ncbi:hypothetical protein QBC46DRAFT_460955 [Diplogelasinospora grovesii]|uniref:Uncharacterized protein n=1 Tax=Diplogelasinospora grovesii TaxID=303347 RepID=A0AAN6N1A8_9PEZI|nr:hypothetical protein QBC46DRAFT_460955 [Diplogelasinospora grovesii]